MPLAWSAAPGPLAEEAQFQRSVTSRRLARSSVWVGAFEAAYVANLPSGRDPRLGRAKHLSENYRAPHHPAGNAQDAGILNSERCRGDRKPEHRRFCRRKGHAVTHARLLWLLDAFVSITTPSWTTTGYRCSPIESRSMPSTGCPRC